MATKLNSDETRADLLTLKEYYSEIEHEVEAKSITTIMEQRHLITLGEKNDIDGLGTRPGRARRMLDVLLSKDFISLTDFMGALRTNGYRELADKLNWSKLYLRVENRLKEFETTIDTGIYEKIAKDMKDIKEILKDSQLESNRELREQLEKKHSQLKKAEQCISDLEQKVKKLADDNTKLREDVTKQGHELKKTAEKLHEETKDRKKFQDLMVKRLAALEIKESKHNGIEPVRKGRMKPEDESCIRRNLEFIKSEIDASLIVDALVSSSTIELADAELVRGCTVTNERNRVLIDTLLHRGPDAYPRFIAVLKEKGYRHVAERLEGTSTEGEQ